MRKLMYRLSVSLDGFIEDAQGGLGWSVPSDELLQHMNDRERATGTVLYGRRLYELMAAHWPTADQDPAASELTKEYARIWRSEPKVIFSTTLQHVEWNSRLVRGHLAEEVNRLKEQPGSDLAVGGAGLAASFMQLGLVDEYWLYIIPVLLGSGKRMFGPLQDKLDLQFLGSRLFPHGVVLLRYEVSR